MKTENEFDIEALPESLRDFHPEWGLVLGSGLGPFVEGLEISGTVDFSDIPGLPPSRVPGHAGRYLFAHIAGKRCMIAQGRVHLYEGHTAREVAAGVRLMAATGVRQLVLTNAAGTANPDFPPGKWMMIRDHLNLTGASPLTGGPNFFDMSEVYSQRLRRRFSEAARDCGLDMREGVYASSPGPQYETPAEVRMLRTLGADAIGMSTVSEAIQARALGIELAGFSCLTNWAAGLSQEPLTHEEVIESGRSAAADFARLIETALAG